MCASGVAHELERLMDLTAGALQEECTYVPYRWRREQSLKLPSTCASIKDRAVAVIGLLQLWVFQKAAQELGMEEFWRQCTSTEKIGVTAPDHFALDGEFLRRKRCSWFWRQQSVTWHTCG